ncbi:MAG: asparaginase [Paludibacterium sp.]|uniref:asparaginase n=1 Tax=Paludibacterium sp. TaxID=1917523 RepID=UPI0025CDE899|nr:asparaginase [Paludibacterium sp.]MBV8047443.1 asparaginase [Paludibacterium sp.]MBV8649212.1 asparaginase [Paludibacterium sp.]
MPRILMLYTGGTIGMADTPEGLAPAPGLLPRLIARLPEGRCELDIVEYPQLIDSSAITPAHWRQIVGDIVGRRDQFDGFIVVHGTDTMAYTASMLAFALQGLAKPVVVTGSQLPLIRPGSDGWTNLSDAIEAACQPDLQEVVIVFDRVMLRGCRARKVDAAGFHGFDSPNCPPLAEFGIVPAWHRARWRSASGALSDQAPQLDANVAAFFLTPGAGAGLIGAALSAQPLDGAVLMSYGNGNAPDDEALLAGVSAAAARGTLVLNITQALRGAVAPGAYAASQPLVRAGAVPGGDLTPEAAVAKLLWVCALPVDMVQKRDALTRDWVGEVAVN